MGLKILYDIIMVGKKQPADEKGGDENESGIRKEIIKYFKRGTGKKRRTDEKSHDISCGRSGRFLTKPRNKEAVRLTNQITLTILNIQEGAVRNGQLPSAKSNNKNDRFAW